MQVFIFYQVTTFEFEKEMILDQDLFCYFDDSAFKTGIQTNVQLLYVFRGSGTEFF